MSLTGTNTYVAGRDPAYVIDPGPADEGHLAAVQEAANERGGLGGVVLTHSHADHSAGVRGLGAPLLWGVVGTGDEGSAEADAKAAAPTLAGDGEVGPFAVIPTPGHAADHVCFLYGEVLFVGDLILGEGSSIVPPAAYGGSLADYLASLDRVAGLDADLFCPGHGPWITDPPAKIDEYREHRLARERALLEALEAGERSRERLLDAAWSDVPDPMRPAAAVAMQAHLEKLEAEGRLPEGIER
jgi:glyoxylase-like metal-dependent hydrolase (beta-lactamase superfamily II)